MVYMRFFFCLIFSFMLAVQAFAGNQAGSIHEAIEKQNHEADTRQSQVLDLKRKADRLSNKLDAVAKRVRNMTNKVKSQEKILNGIRKNEETARKEHFVLEARKDVIFKELNALLKTLWPVHVQNVQSRFAGVDSWAMADRRFNWLSSVYDATRIKFLEAREMADQLKINLERQRLLEKEAEYQLARINKSKDRLLQDKWTLRASLKKVTSKKRSLESELQDILATIKQLNYQLSTQKTKKFDFYKRSLPWPVDGDVISRFNLRAKPPRRGLSLRVIDEAEVRSIFWGKVVHNDTLRGFGKVVIVYHGYNYYSLYAYLQDTFVETGQEVEKDEPIGRAGFYPLVDGPGLYFELRFHQKPINPDLWLTSLN